LRQAHHCGFRGTFALANPYKITIHGSKNQRIDSK